MRAANQANDKLDATSIRFRPTLLPRLFLLLPVVPGLDSSVRLDNGGRRIFSALLVCVALALVV
jgi:hypothetical protein